ncbi:MAG: hypothetical protein FRX49_12172 [Trebouxia sp. A1-2]|nr:MAG: hypothetical protein FRX49_12172 [Trebouxia sp. A1-2]
MWLQDSPALPHHQTLSHQPSLGRLQQQTTLNHTNWPTKRASGGFAGPPVETGATLPYRDTPRPGPTGIPAVSLSRSVTSGARQVQAGLQPSKPLLSNNLQPTIPLLSSAESQPQSFFTSRSEWAHQVLQAATQSAIPHLVPSGLSHLPQTHLPRGTHQTAPPLPGMSAGAGAFELPLPSAQAQAGMTGSPGSFPSQILTASPPLQNSVLQSSEPAGAAACADEAAPLGNSSEMQGSATDGGSDPNAKKMKVHMDADVEDAPHGHKLTEAERRRVRRRATNRESAKRIRDKREEQMTLMSEQVTKLEAHKAGLLSHMHNVEDCCAQLMEQLKALKEKWCATCVENVKLYKRIFELRKALNPGTESSQLAAQLALDEELPMPAGIPAHAESAAAPESEPVNQVEVPDLRDALALAGGPPAERLTMTKPQTNQATESLVSEK